MNLKRLREKDDKGLLNNLSLKARRRWHPVLRWLMGMHRKLSGIKVYALKDHLPQLPEGRQCIFVLTHCGKEDMVVFAELVGEHWTCLNGDYESLHNTIDGAMLALNGCVFFDMRSIDERKTIIPRVEQVLKDGDHILCSMEAAWNTSPNKICQQLFTGMIKAAMDTNSVIVPVGMERFDGKSYGINFPNEVFDPALYMNIEDGVNKCRDDLRMKMADLKFQLYLMPEVQKKITTDRKAIGDFDEYNKWFANDIVSDYTFTAYHIERKRFREKNEPKYAFAYVVDKYKKIDRLTEEQFCELINDIMDPVYPNDIRNELAAIADRYLLQ